jgi:hypothetical protein
MDGLDSQRLRVSRDQIVTLWDLEILKKELLDEIRNILKQNEGSPSKKWLKSSEVKKLLGISTGTLQNLRVNGSLSHSKVGGIYFYDYNDIAKLIKKNEQR